MRELNQHRILHAFRGGEYAFALPDGDHGALEEIVGWCCDVWNGANNLLIPVAEDGAMSAWVEPLIGLRGLDLVIVHPRVGEAAVASLADRFGPGRVARYWHGLLERDLHPLNLQPGFLLPPDREPRRALPIPVYGGEVEQRIACVAWGRLDPADEADYSEAFELEPHEGDAAHFALSAAQVERVSPLGQSVYLMRLIEQISGDRSRQLFVLDADDFEQLVFFWNIRSCSVPLAEPLVIGLPLSAFEAPDRLHPLVDWVGLSPFGAIKPDIVVVASEAVEPIVEAALNELGFRAAPEGSGVTEYWGEVPEERRPLEFSISRLPSIGGSLMRGISSDALVLLGGGLNHLRLDAHPDFRFRYSQEVFFEMIDVPHPFPWNDAAAGRAMLNLRGADRVLSLKTSASRRINIDLTLPSHDDALADYLQSRGLTSELSRAGRWAQGLLARLDSLDALDSLATREAVQILDGLAPLSRLKATQRISGALKEQLGAQAPTEAQVEALLREHVILLELRSRRLSEIASAGGRSPRELLPAMESLIANEFVYRGHLTTCPNCRYEQFRSLDTLGEKIGCAACRTSYLLAVSDGQGREPPLSYQLDGLMARVMDQDLLPVLLALRALFTRGSSPLSAAFWPGIELRAEDFTREADLLLAIQRSITIVECKRRAEAMTVEETSRTAELAERLGGRAVLAALDGEFGDDTVIYAQDQGIQLLTRENLLTSSSSSSNGNGRPNRGQQKA